MKPASSSIEKVYSILREELSKYRMPVVDLIEIQTNDPFKVLIATILSARTRDETTSVVAERLFADVQSFEDFDKYTTGELEKLIYPVGFFREKARKLKELPSIINNRFKGSIPQTVEELIELPGVGRKTANLVVAVAFNKPAICVDIHVHRICNRLGYVKTKTPFETEMTLRNILPVKYWTTFNSCFVSFGQNTCKPVNPQCNRCPVYKYCSRVDVKSKHLDKLK
jgi:endonuclease III